ncbi:MAG: HPr family phosphocarrier protein [Pseudomonadales bacterium]|uniref:Phosphocarrier HPr protein n=1 Tax=Oleiphilus messinensis TaxID=141451 RepID=A0A1Y0I657_9GAMM|nr:HPr family phosphocarrier protein [Oleiphilus messinensis]ARU55962.1 phosphocarrier HPr protein [Oleiphilus messinensis]MCG8610540.1 HPr family phosphocarrier protein [Pseudomonadales bacterium]
MLREKITIINQLGLHARASAKLVSTAGRFSAKVSLCKDDRTVDAKSIMSVMLLAASCGMEVEIETDGPDEHDAMEAVKALINDKFGEGQ